MILIIVLAVQLLFLEKYLIGNLMLFGVDHGGIEWLVLYIIFALISNSIVLVKKSRINLRLSVLLLIIFMIYFAYRCAVDLTGQDWLRKFVGSDAGILYHLLLGFLSAAPIAYAIDWGCEINRSTKLFKLLVSIFLVICIINSFDLMHLAAEKSRGDLFLVETGDDMYQWPGDLLAMRTLISTMLSGYLISLFEKDRNLFFRKFGKFLILIMQAVQFGVLLFYSQVLGSNKAVLIILGCWLSLVSVLFASRIVRREGSNEKACSIGIFSLMCRTLLRTAVLTFVIGGLLILAAIKTNFPFDKFRIFGFGTGEISSFQSRLDLIVDGFLLQFSISPFFGHAAADYLTLGEGRYIHSTVAYALTHTGIIGFLILTAVVIMALVEQNFDFIKKENTEKDYRVDNWQMKFIGLMIFLVVLFVGIVSSSLIWGVAWFGIGLFLASWSPKSLYIKIKF
jgi:hypothetical protein